MLPSSASKLPFAVPIAAAIMISVLFVASCSTCRTTESSEIRHGAVSDIRSAELVAQEIRVTQKEIPADTVHLAVPISTLRELAPDVPVSTSKGRAKVTIRHRDGMIDVTASCDSLLREVEYHAAVAAAFQKENRMLRMERKSAEKKEKKGSAWGHWIEIISSLAVLIFLVYIIFYNKLKT